VSKPAWSDADIRLLRHMWLEGRSAREIAQAVENQSGRRVSKAAVVGKADRIGLPPHVARPTRSVSHLPSDARASNAKTCQWPHGHPGSDGFHFCGEKAVPGKPYCETHCEVAYQKTGEPTEEAA
jgi:GcrA cell cycle regulator